MAYFDPYFMDHNMYANKLKKKDEVVIGLSRMVLSLEALNNYCKQAKDNGAEKIVFMDMNDRDKDFVITL